MVDVLVVVDDVEVVVVKVVDREVDEVVVDVVVDTVDVEDVVVVVVSQPLQVLAQFVMLATRLSHKPCSLKAMHLLDESVSVFPSHGSIDLTLETSKGVVDAGAVGLVVSQPLHVLSHPPIRVPHKPAENIPWHEDRSNEFSLPSQRLVLLEVVVMVVEDVLVVMVDVLVVVTVVDVLVIVLVEVVYVVVLVLVLVDVDVLVVVVSQLLHVLSH